jgi:site-specific recombinase XerC
VPLPGILRRDDPQQEHPHSLLPGLLPVLRLVPHKLGALAHIDPLHVAAYIETMQSGFEKPSVKQHLAAIRMLFDWLITCQVVATNLAHSVRGPKHVMKTGKTTVLDAERARRLLESIDISTLVELRDRARDQRHDLRFRPQ